MAGIASDRQGLARYQRVGTLAEYRRLGLASRLLAEAGSFAVDSMGADLLVIVADLDAPAARLYRSLGFIPTETVLGLSASVPRPSRPSPTAQRCRTSRWARSAPVRNEVGLGARCENLGKCPKFPCNSSTGGEL